MTAPIPLFLNTGGVFIEFIYFRFWQLVVDPLPPQDAKNLEEHLGIERDTSEHAALEQGSLCQQKRKFWPSQLKGILESYGAIDAQ